MVADDDERGRSEDRRATLAHTGPRSQKVNPTGRRRRLLRSSMLIAGLVIMAPLVMVMILVEARGRPGPAYGVTKTLASIWFCVVGIVALDDVASTQASRPWFIAALLCSLLGDVLLIPKGRKRVFLAGLVAFLVAHALFIPAWSVRGLHTGVTAAIAVVVIIVSAVVLRWLRPHVKGPLWGAVVVYVVIIGAMLATAWGAVAHGATVSGGVTPALGGGALSFWCSDLFVARQRFVRPGLVNRVVGIPLYYFGQLGLIAGCVG
jgi:uncharacterized membrane protein YhhN